MAHDLEVESKVYPNGDTYFLLSINGEDIGTVTEVDGGFLAHGRRKPVATITEAAKQLLDAKMNRCMKEHERLRKLLANVLGMLAKTS